MISLVFAFKVTIFIRLGHKLSVKYDFFSICIESNNFYQIRSQTVCKVMISLIFAFKVTVFIRLHYKLCGK